MLTSIGLVFFLVSCSYAANCPATSNKVTSCSVVNSTSGCSNWFQWSYNADMDYNDIPPYVCTPNTATGMCKSSTTTCTPSCKVYDDIPGSAKRGGLSGKVCNDYSGNGVNNRYVCTSSYMWQDGGDRWCFWRANSNFCYMGLICHD